MLLDLCESSYLDVLRKIHMRTFSCYLEIGARSGRSLSLSRSPSIAIDPYFKIEEELMKEKQRLSLFQCTSDVFFEQHGAFLEQAPIEVAFVDGMHLFEYVLRDISNTANYTASSSVILVHDVLPTTFGMATRKYEAITPGAPWTGDVWKVIPILARFVPREDIVLIPAKPTGLLALFNLSKKESFEVFSSIELLISEWRDCDLSTFGPEEVYESATLCSSDCFLERVKDEEIGSICSNLKHSWVSP